MNDTLRTLDAAGISMTEVLRRFLERQGLDVDTALAHVKYRHARQAEATRAQVENLRILASRVKRAHRAWDTEMYCWRNGWGTATLATVSQRQGEYEQLRTMFREGCQNDPALISQLMREA